MYNELILAVSVIGNILMGYFLYILCKKNTLFKSQAAKDPLTGLWNRRGGEEIFLSRVASEQRLAFKTESKFPPIALLIADIDFFKIINDQYGHVVGDKVLKEFSQMMRDFFRLSDIIYRFGGEEFVVILIDTTEEAAAKKAEQFRKKVFEYELPALKKIGRHLSVSIGVSWVDIHADTEIEGAVIREYNVALERADAALYRAKSGGRNRVELSE